MSRYFSNKFAALKPYTPGEQPQNMTYIKLNTNESPFPPSPIAMRMARQAAGDLQLYSDPDCRQLLDAATQFYGIDKKKIACFNGSDEALNFAFMAYCDQTHPAAFPDITYGFYPVFAQVTGIPYETIPLREDLTINPADYLGIGKTIFIANPNAPTGIALPLSDIERIVASNPGSVVVIDEAYVDFGGESALKLIDKYDNLLVIQTFSKSRSLAGGRLGFAFGCEELIADLNAIRFSTNPYNINRMTMAAGAGALLDVDYFEINCQIIAEARAWTVRELQNLGFTMPDSKANFVFATKPGVSGKDLYLGLKERGILVRWFDKDRLRDYVRITIGSFQQMETLISTLKEMKI